VPVRTSPVFAVALTATVPSPVPLAPEVIESHDTLLVADHVHSSVVMTANGPAAPPLAPIDTAVGMTEYEHGVGVAAWLIVTICAATVSVPVRAAPLFEATLNVTVLVPMPLVRPVSEIHDVLLLADHSHREGAVIDTESPLLVAAETDMVFGETVELAQLGGAASWSTVTD
jgi:hypothetical protein